MRKYLGCPYIALGTISVYEGDQVSCTCLKHRRIVGQSHCEECRLIVTRTARF